MNTLAKDRPNDNVKIYIPKLSFPLSTSTFLIPTLTTFTTLVLDFLPCNHSALQVLRIGKSHHFQDLAGLPASVSTSAV
jgi:hypothetical protein